MESTTMKCQFCKKKATFTPAKWHKIDHTRSMKCNLCGRVTTIQEKKRGRKTKLGMSMMNKTKTERGD